jgi:hypothetical protein
MAAFQTHKIVIDMGGRKFSTLQIGSSQVSVLREEHSLLLAVAAAACNCDIEDLTVDQVKSLDLKALRARAAQG